jgi:CubicO group peptidase (beta-lactamase class C family)
MRIYLLSLFLFILGSSSCSSQKEIATPKKESIENADITQSNISETQKQLVEKCLSNYPDATQLSIAIIDNAETEFYGCIKDKSKLTEAENSSSLFEIGSLTKIFTSTILADFIINDKIKGEENIYDHLANDNITDKNISFLELSNHTSGLPRLPTNLDLTKTDPFNPYKNYDEASLLEYLSGDIKLVDQGSKSSYSNLGAGLLGYVLKTLDKKDFKELYSTYIFDKYGMTESYVNRTDITSGLVTGLDGSGRETSGWDLNVLLGAGGIISSTKDLSQFVVKHFNTKDAVLELSRKENFKVNDRIGKAMGWSTLHTNSGQVAYWHGGGTGGYTSYILMNPENKKSIVILSNVSAFHSKSGDIEKLSFDLYKTLLK